MWGMWKLQLQVSFHVCKSWSIYWHCVHTYSLFPFSPFFSSIALDCSCRISNPYFQLPNYEFHHNFELVQFPWKKDFFHRDFFTTKSLHNNPINVDSFCCWNLAASIVKSGHDNIDVVTGRIATAATREVQKPAAQAAQAVAAAWEATMELGEVRTDDTQSSYYCSRARRMRSSWR